MENTISVDDHRAVLAEAAKWIRANREGQIKSAEDLAQKWKEPAPHEIEMLKWSYSDTSCGKRGNVIARTIDYLERHKYDIRAEIEYCMLNGYSLSIFEWSARTPSSEKECTCQSDDSYYDEPTPDELAKYEAERAAREIKKRAYKPGCLSRLFPKTGNRYQIDIFGTSDYKKWFALRQWLHLYYGYSIVASDRIGPGEHSNRQLLSIYWA